MNPSDGVNPFDLNETIHQRSRLAIMTVLREAGEADFAFLKDNLDLTDGNLGRHLEVLATAGYVSTRRGYDGRRSRTWVRITPQGSTALQLEIDSLRAIIDRADATS
ncbi:transcriptional regulator [Cryobacterium sp. Hz9]|uniref:winged helix-turn-helix domain-containing protein n=1 Tax=Cryobacterium sp. Hz9 TaxID=1259167 RepID=UPI00106A8567|nr:transcriptional regulator [Cryobacterium sp. Hz9]TFB66154.1 ArsR family transcriptional regulator [Cryobacterium sp. Hz9]